MFHSLHKQRLTLGRGMIFMLVAMWMSLAVQSCAMAAEALEHIADIPCMQQDEMSGEVECQPTLDCATQVSQAVPDTAGVTDQRLPAQPAMISWDVFDHLPSSLSPPLTQRQVSINSLLLARFCILRI